MIKNKLQNGIKGFSLLIIIAVIVQLSGCKANQTESGSEWSLRMVESIIKRRPAGYGDWDYVTGTVLKGFEKQWFKTRDERHLNYIKKTVDNVVGLGGTIADYDISKYNIDEIKEGRVLLFLFKETGDIKYKQAADLLRKQLAEQPRNSQGGFWHKKRYPYQMWLDGLYMGSPFYAEYGLMFDEPENFDDVIKQFVLIEKHTRHSKTGLLYHAWDEKKEQSWADPETGLSKIFWGRAMGWYAMALVDVLDYLPNNHSGRGDLIAILQRFALAISKVQDDATGVWWQVVDQPGREGNYLEASCSSMFVYALAKGIRLGYLEKKYTDIVKKAYQGILNEFVTENPDGTINLIKICKSAGLGFGRDGSYDYYVYQEEKVENDGKGVGPFITASIEVEMLDL